MSFKGLFREVFFQNLNVFVLLVFVVSFASFSMVGGVVGLGDVMEAPDRGDRSRSVCMSAVMGQCQMALDSNESSVSIDTPVSCISDGEVIVDNLDEDTMGGIDAEITADTLECRRDR